MKGPTKILAAAIGLLALAGSGFGQGLKLEISLLGGTARIGAFGEAVDYQAGTNDFPVTPKHNAGAFGGVLGMSLGRYFGLELGARYQTGADVVLTDPSDEDTVPLKTSAHASAVLRALLEFPLGPVRLYALAGGGLDLLSGEAQSAVTRYGYVVDFEKPTKSTRTLAEAGGGCKVFIGSRFGLRAEARYAVIFADSGSIKTLHWEGGIVIRL